MENCEGKNECRKSFSDVFIELQNMPEWRITNIIVGFSTGCIVDLPKWDNLKHYLTTATFIYDRKKFNGATLKLAKTNATIQLFRTGKAVMLGLHSFDECTAAMLELVDVMQQAGYQPSITDIKLHNICVSYKFNFFIDLENLVINNKPLFYLEYELSPNVKMFIDKSCVTITRSGVVYITGHTDLLFYSKIYDCLAKILPNYKKSYIK